MAGQVDGYGPGELDDIHWDLLAGAVVAVVAGGALLYFSLDATGSAGTALLIAGAALVVAALAALSPASIVAMSSSSGGEDALSSCRACLSC